MKKVKRQHNQKDCDKLLSPILVKFKPVCLLCGGRTQVAHHHVHKSKSLALRYDFENLINLCNGCHFKLHHNESYWASRVLQIKGMKWFVGLEKRKGILMVGTLKINYNEVYEKLLNILNGQTFPS